MENNLISILSVLFGTGGIGYAIIARLLDKRKYKQEVREATANADIKGDEFWKQRYDVLQKEVKDKDDWWKARYDTLYQEYQNERKLSNEIVKSFRTELEEMRADYDKQRELERMKYEDLMKRYKEFEEESQRREKEYKERISQLEKVIEGYEQRLS